MTTDAEMEKTPLRMIAADLSSFYDDPFGYVMWNFPW